MPEVCKKLPSPLGVNLGSAAGRLEGREVVIFYRAGTLGGVSQALLWVAGEPWS